MNQYYLIPKQIIDSRIEELQKASEKYYTQNHLGMQNATNDIINLLQSLTQQSELVELIDVNKLEKTYRKEFDNYSEKGFAVSTMMTHIYRNYKLIKTITK